MPFLALFVSAAILSFSFKGNRRGARRASPCTVIPFSECRCAFLLSFFILLEILLSFFLYSLVQHVIDRQAFSFSEKPLVENNGFEPLTPCLQSRCSSQLS